MPIRWNVPQHASTLEQLDAALGDGAQRGAVVLGPDGVGKSTLARLAAEHFSSQHPSTFIRWVTGTPTERAVPFGAFSHLVELTDIGSDRGPWWTLGFEATGPDSFVRQSLDATAAVMFAQPLPRAADLGPSQCQSYAQWLRNAPTEHQALMRARTRRG